MWRNIVEMGRPQITILLMCFAYWVTEAVNTLSEYVIFIDLPVQQWLHERASLTFYVHCLSCVHYY